MKLLAIFFFLFLSCPTFAGNIFLVGYIGPNTAANIIEQYEALSDKKNTVLVIDSNGGQIFEMLKILRFVIENKISTHCQKACYSAAATLWLAGSIRTMDENAALLFHEITVFPPKEMPIRDLEHFTKKRLKLNHIYNKMNAIGLKMPLSAYQKKVFGKDWVLTFADAQKLKLIIR